MRNIALHLMYNGTAYHGWQVQKTEITVAETLERGLARESSRIPRLFNPPELVVVDLVPEES